jgi:hypothetical protein
MATTQNSGINSIPPTGDPEADGIIGAVKTVIGPLQKQFPRGTFLGNWLSDIGNFKQAWSDMSHALFGYKYTGGDYALGEVFIDRVLGQATTSRWDTPNGYVPIAWTYMTLLFGLPIAVNTDLDTLTTSDSLEGYLSGRPEQRTYVTQAQVTRAHQLMTLIVNYPRLGGWSPDKNVFGLVPYVCPLPDARNPGVLYNGPMPNGQNIVNGVPDQTAATKGSNVSGFNGSNFNMTYIIIAIAIIILLILIFK